MQKQFEKPKYSITSIPPHALHINLQLSKSSEIPSYLKAASVKEVLKYILFSRGVFPIQPDDLLRHMEQWHNESLEEGIERNRKVSAIRQRRKYQKYGQQLQNVLKDIDDLFKDCNVMNHEKNRIDIKAILITLGPTFSSPREQYVLRFLDWGPMPSTSTSESGRQNSLTSHVKERLQKEIGRRSVREIILGTLQEGYTNMFQHKSSECSTMKVNIAAFVTESTLDALFQQQVSIKDLSSLTFSERKDSTEVTIGGANDRSNDMFWYDFFAPRHTVLRQFDLRIPRMYSKRKGHRPFVVLDVMPMLRPSHVVTSDDNNVPQMVDKDCTWMTLKSFIKGFKI
jgi:hypothetical protein